MHLKRLYEFKCCKLGEIYGKMLKVSKTVFFCSNLKKVHQALKKLNTFKLPNTLELLFINRNH